ncbi:uncharacterized protein LOC127131467 [Lathyrus oleraceus]|uniref:uncharacterized protein LOC127131467 n=1 Tax=Pisum sativum TaxID=3888 RepID=UPI0021D0E540|nr:uncharacterized protein LOC127131467 [Pisum sativum]
MAIIETCATHSFICFNCAKRLGLDLSSMVGSMIVDTPTLRPMTTSVVCLNCPLTIYGNNFGMDLVCLSLNKLDVILGINWLEFNQVHINCYNKYVLFLEIDEDGGLFVMTKQASEVVNVGAQVFVMLASMSAEVKAAINEIPVACEFLELFPNDISDFPLEREIKFAIDLVNSTNPVLMARYRIYNSDLSELKKQLEELLEKKFVQPCVSP